MTSASVRLDEFTASDPDGLVYGPGSPLINVKRTCLRIAGSDATVLLSGETGTGKEVFARLIHKTSPRASRPFVPVNCGAIPETLLESELFGFVKGAFTGAVNSRRGRVALAEGGTLFLDEIGELPLPLQVKLLRLLQERSYEPVGSSESVSANFRLVAATNRDLLREVRAGRFRRDLYYRLNVCPVRLPALRERPSDITVLFAHFWHQRGEHRPVEPEVMATFQNYSWPGNVRELENVAERLSVCAEGPVIARSDLEGALVAESDETRSGPMALVPGAGLADPSEVTEIRTDALPSAAAAASTNVVDMNAHRVPFDSVAELAATPTTPAGFVAALAAAAADSLPGSAPGAAAAAQDTADINGPLPPIKLPVDMPRLFRDLEEAYIRAALAATDGNRKEAAALLGMGRTTLVEKLRRRQFAWSDIGPGERPSARANIGTMPGSPSADDI